MRKLTYILAILVIAMGVGAGMFFSQCERLSDVLQQSYGYSGGKANAVKHAYAAAKIYDGLRGLGFAPDRVESVIGFSGVANEYAERVVKFRKPDPVQEIMKDLHNNFAGVRAAEWTEAGGHRVAVLDVIMALADNGVLITDRDHNPFGAGDDTGSPVADASAWFDAHKAEIDARIRGALLQRRR